MKKKSFIGILILSIITIIIASLTTVSLTLGIFTDMKTQNIVLTTANLDYNISAEIDGSSVFSNYNPTDIRTIDFTVQNLSNNEIQSDIGLDSVFMFDNDTDISNVIFYPSTVSNTDILSEISSSNYSSNYSTEITNNIASVLLGHYTIPHNNSVNFSVKVAMKNGLVQGNVNKINVKANVYTGNGIGGLGFSEDLYDNNGLYLFTNSATVNQGVQNIEKTVDYITSKTYTYAEPLVDLNDLDIIEDDIYFIDYQNNLSSYGLTLNNGKIYGTPENMPENYILRFNYNNPKSWVSYSSSTNGTYIGTITLNFELGIIYINDTSSITVGNFASQTYTGSELTPDVVITNLRTGDTLIKDTDYKLEYSNNADAGTADVTITGIGLYDGTVTKQFIINSRNLSNTAINNISSMAYEGSELEPNPTITYNGMTLVKDIDYKLEYDNNIEPGQASVYITGMGNYTGNATKYFTISKRVISMTVISNPSPMSFTYDGTAHEPAITITSNGNPLIENTDYELDYDDNVNAGTCTITITGIGSHYIGTTTKTFVINKADAKITTSALANDITYDTNSHILNTAAVGDGGTLYYRLYSYTDNSSNTTTYNNNWSTSRPSGTNAGTYVVQYYVEGDSNHNDTDISEVSVTIDKASFTSSVTISDYQYGGTVSTPSVTNNPGNATVLYYGRSNTTGGGTIWSSVTNTTFNAGTRYCYAVISGTNNYNGYTTNNTAFNISKADFTASVSIDNYTYAGTKSTPSVTNNPGNGTVTYYGRSISSGSATNWSSVTSTTYNAGTRYIYAYIAETTNYNSYTTGNTSFTISKASFTASVSISDYTYAGTKSTPLVTNNPGNGTVTYYGRATSSGSTTEWSNVTSTTYDAGTRYIYAYIAETTNYNSYTTGNTSFTISKADSSVNTAPTANTLTYSGSSQTLITAGTANNGTMYYRLYSYKSNTASSATTYNNSYSTTRPTGTDAGTYVVQYYVVGNTNYNNTSVSTVNVTISKASFTATVSISGYTYAGTKSTPSVTNNPGNGTVTYYGRSTSSGSATNWSNVTSTTYNAGQRYCYAIISATNNYNSYTTENTPFNISKASFTASVSISNYTYAGTKSTPSVTNNPGGGTVTYYGRATSSGTTTNWSSVTSTTYDAGTRYIYAYIAATTNYNSYTTGNTSFTINKASASITTAPTARNLTYAGNSDDMELVTSGYSSQGTMYYRIYSYQSPTASSATIYSYSYSTDIYYSASARNAGTYVVQYYAKSNNTTNYNDSSVYSVTVIINPYDISDAYKTEYMHTSKFEPKMYNLGHTFEYTGSDLKQNASNDVEIYAEWENEDGYECFYDLRLGTDFTTSFTNSSCIYPGTYYFTITGCGNYCGTITGSYLYIYNGTPTYSTTPSANNLTYTGSSQYLTTAGSANNGTVYYRLYQYKSPTASSYTTYSNSYSTTRPTGLNAGTYIVQYYIQGNSYYNNTSVSTVNVTINQASTTVTLGSTSGTVTYNSTNTFTAKGSVAGTLATTSGNTTYVTITGNSSVSASANTNYTITYKGAQYRAGTTTLTVKLTPSNSNYASSTATYSVTQVYKASQSAPTSLTASIDGTTVTLTASGSGSTLLQYSKDGSTWQSSNVFSNCSGTITFYARYASSTNYNASSSKTVSISIKNGLWTDYAASSFAGGSGTSADPYQIATAEQLAYLAKSAAQSGKYYKVTANIDLSAHYWVPINSVSNPDYIDFNGNEKKIVDMEVNPEGNYTYAGLFGRIEEMTVENVQLINPVVKNNNSQYIGALVGYCYRNYKGTMAYIKNIYLENILVEGGTISTGGCIGYYKWKSSSYKDYYGFSNNFINGGICKGNGSQVSGLIGCVGDYWNGSVTGNNIILDYLGGSTSTYLCGLYQGYSNYANNSATIKYNTVFVKTIGDCKGSATGMYWQNQSVQVQYCVTNRFVKTNAEPITSYSCSNCFYDTNRTTYTSSSKGTGEAFTTVNIKSILSTLGSNWGTDGTNIYYKSSTLTAHKTLVTLSELQEETELPIETPTPTPEISTSPQPSVEVIPSPTDEERRTSSYKSISKDRYSTGDTFMIDMTDDLFEDIPIIDEIPIETINETNDKPETIEDNSIEIDVDIGNNEPEHQIDNDNSSNNDDGSSETDSGSMEIAYITYFDSSWDKKVFNNKYIIT